MFDNTWINETFKDHISKYKKGALLKDLVTYKDMGADLEIIYINIDIFTCSIFSLSFLENIDGINLNLTDVLALKLTVNSSSPKACI